MSFDKMENKCEEVMKLNPRGQVCPAQDLIRPRKKCLFPVTVRKKGR